MASFEKFRTLGGRLSSAEELLMARLADLEITAESVVLDHEKNTIRVLLSDALMLSPSSRFYSRVVVENLEKRLSDEIGNSIEISFTTSVTGSIEQAIESLLKINYQDVFGLVTMTLVGPGLVVIETEIAPGKAVPAGVAEKIVRLLGDFSLSLKSFIARGESRRSIRAKDILDLVRVGAPIGEEPIIFELLRSVEGSTEKEIRNRLDVLRKDGLLIRRSDGKYVLTERGVSATPGSTRRDSFDIQRLLALAKRSW